MPSRTVCDDKLVVESLRRAPMGPAPLPSVGPLIDSPRPATQSGGSSSASSSPASQTKSAGATEHHEPSKKKKSKKSSTSGEKPKSASALSPPSEKGKRAPQQQQSTSDLSSSSHHSSSPRRPAALTGNSTNEDTTTTTGFVGSPSRPASRRNIAILAEWTRARATDPPKPSSDSKLASILATTQSDEPSFMPRLTTTQPTGSTNPGSTLSMIHASNSTSASTSDEATAGLKADVKATNDVKSDVVLVDAKAGSSNRDMKSPLPQKEATRPSILKKYTYPASLVGGTEGSPWAVKAVDFSNLSVPLPTLPTTYPSSLGSLPPMEISTGTTAELESLPPMEISTVTKAKLKPPPTTSVDPSQVTQPKPADNPTAPLARMSPTKGKSALKVKAPPSPAPAPVISAPATSPPSESNQSSQSERTLMKRAPPLATKSSESLPGTRMPGASSSTSVAASSTSAPTHRGVASSFRSTNKLAAMEAVVQQEVILNAPPPSPPPSLPGAYLVQGRNVELAATSVLSSHRPTLADDIDDSGGTVPNLAVGYEIHATLVETESTEASAVNNSHGNGNRKSTKKKKANRESSTKSSSKSLVVAGGLTEDIEAKIEMEVQRRLLEQTTKADIIAVDRGNNYSHRVLPPAEEVKRIADLKDAHRPKGVREKLFGDVRQRVDIASSPECIRRRDYLLWTVKRNPTTSQWVASVMTNQQAMQEGDTIEMELSKVSYVASNQEEAYETGLANAAPMMQSMDEHPICFICKAKFAVFRRACNCRNCGVCVCSACSTTWPSKMLPDTYLNKKDKATVSACIACDWLATSFREALLDGHYKAAIDMYKTGNINLRSPFCLDKRGEHLYPVHLAILGGNLNLVRWLVSERFCPLRTHTKKGRKFNDCPILSSKGRSPLEIALLDQRVDIVYYLVVEMNQSLFEENVVNSNMALANFTSLLKMLPVGFFEGRQLTTTSVPLDGTAPLSQTFSYSGSDGAERRPSL